jgi:hypothetical protein
VELLATVRAQQAARRTGSKRRRRRRRRRREHNKRCGVHRIERAGRVAFRVGGRG